MSNACLACLQEKDKEEFIRISGTKKHIAFCVPCWDKYSKEELISLVVGNLKNKAVPKDVKRKIKKVLKKLSRGK